MQATYRISRDRGSLFGFLTANSIGTDARNAVAEFARQNPDDITSVGALDTEGGVDITIGIRSGADMVRLQHAWARTLRDFGVVADFVRRDG